MLLLQSVGRIPATNVDVNVVTAMKVVSLGIGMVKEFWAFHSRDHFREEIFCTASEVFVIPIGIDLNMIAAKVNVALFHSQYQADVIANTERGLDAIPFTDGLDSGGQTCFVLLTHVCHVGLLFCYAMSIL